MRVAQTLDELVERGLTRAQAEQCVWLAYDAGIIKFTKAAPMLEDREAEGEVTSEMVQAIVCQSQRPRVVATTPAFGEVSTSATLVVFQQIIAAASHELTIASPYLDYGGIDLLKNILANACKRGVRVRVLTRETAANDFGRTEGIRRLREMFGDLLELRDYHFTVDGRHRTSVHAKLLLADDALGYIGSAEIRRNAIANNFELGMVIQKPDTSNAMYAFDTFWRLATKVDPL